MKMRVVSLALSVGLLASGALAAYAVLADAPSSMSTDRQSGNGLQPPPATPTVGVPPGESVAAALARAKTEAPGLAKVASAVQSEDVKGLLDLLAWEETECVPPGSRDGSRPSCATLGVAIGTRLLVFPEFDGVAYYRDRPALTETLSWLLKGTNPRLELVASLGAGKFYISFTLDERPSPESGSAIVNVTMTLDTSQSVPVQSFERGVKTHTPFDVLREYARVNGIGFEVWGASQELVAREEAKHKERYGE